MAEEYDFNRIRDAIADYFNRKPPADVVPRQGLDRKALLDLNRLADEPMTTAEHHGITVKGNSVTVSEPDTYNSTTEPIVTRAVLERAGLTPADVPSIRVVGK